MPLGVESAELGEGPGKRSGGDLESDLVLVGVVVDKVHLRSRSEWHVPIAIPPAVRDVAERQGGIHVGAGRGAEEVPERRPYAGIGFAIPFDLQGQLAQRIVIGGRGGQAELDSESGDGGRTA